MCAYLSIFIAIYPKCSLVQNSKQDLDNYSMSKNKELPRVLGKKMQALRKKRRMTQEDLAEKVGVSATYIGFIEQGRYAPSLDLLEKIAKILRVKVNELIPF